MKYLFALTLLFSIPCVAQRPPARVYNTRTVETVTGPIISVNQSTNSRRGGFGLHLQIDVEGVATAVHLGPSWYIEKEGFSFQTGEVVTVTGSRVSSNGSSYIIAATVVQGTEQLNLRDQYGIPAWSRAGRRGR